MTQEHLEGLIAAPPTPMRPDGGINLDAVDEVCRVLTANGVAGAFICGTAGESLSLTPAERRQVAERWRAAVGRDFALIVHVGHNCLPEAKDLAAHAQEVGADAVAAMAPSYFKPANVDDLALFCADVAAAAPELPFYYYHIPTMTGVAIPVADLLEVGTERIPTLAGAKFTSTDLKDFARCLAAEDGRFDMLFAGDEIVLSALALGARAAVGLTYSFAAGPSARMMEAYRAGDMRAAQREQSRVRELMTVVNRFGGLAALKPAMKAIGVDCGPPRLPQRPLSEAEWREFRQGLERIGFFEYCNRT
jgi:N-acetylneuraminate lyase